MESPTKFLKSKILRVIFGGLLLLIPAYLFVFTTSRYNLVLRPSSHQLQIKGAFIDYYKKKGYAPQGIW